jgi:CBS domain-containing protein
VADTQTKKTSIIARVDANSTMARAFLLLSKHQSKSIPVTSQDEIVGVISARDIARIVKDYGPGSGTESSQPLTVGHYMQSPVRHVEATDDMASVVQMMLDRRVGAVVVKSDGEVVGCINRDDLLDLLATLMNQRRESVLKTFQDLQTGVKAST